MTSNIGAHIIQENMESMTDENRDTVLAKTKVEVYEQLKKSIRPEFLNRIDEVILFEPLTRSEIKEIVRLQLNAVSVMLAKNDIRLTITPEATDWLAQLGYDPQFGARPLKRVIQKRVLNELSKQILGGTINKEDLIEVDIDSKNNMVFKNKKEELVN
jgi:ATP-dependent Clp protease ATP-binding subunit ClpB